MKKNIIKVLVILVIIICSIPCSMASRADWEDLIKDGYAVVYTTYIDGYDFDGCDWDKWYKFQNGLKFQCQEYNYHYSYNPKVYILMNRYGRCKVVIDNEEFRGQLYR